MALLNTPKFVSESDLRVHNPELLWKVVRISLDVSSTSLGAEMGSLYLTVQADMMRKLPLHKRC
jgi:hypothetical protein